MADNTSTAGRGPASKLPEGPRVLIVDDDRDVAEGTAEVLADSGFSVRTALTAHSAVEIARSFDAQIALVDMNLGHGGNGLHLLPVLRDLRPRIVMVVVTAYRNKQAVDAVSRSGAHGYLRKPFYPQELFKVLDYSIEQLQGLGRTPRPGGKTEAA